ncbi:YafY family transcriptional regulator [Paenibacillus donghaensis]|uniref:helix-turn-helix transcriptional regulator n=1 Tax=Paenibacillus donghaensis TaxID=414771 RepID=UPI001883472D|nr:YafY family protein [Paenibacillus donghaensis]MBE9917587.1 YafY family transcriptional regulator [Paenibacillus donghaensis]
MKLERLISMIYMLLNHEILSASALAEKYNVSQRTIYRDIEAICAAGIPVVSYQGVNGGYGIMEEYKMDKSLLGSHDVNSIVTLLRSMSDIFEDEKAEETIHKLQSVYQAGKPSMSLDIGSWRPYNETLRELKDAITKQLVLQFEYVSAKGERVKRFVEPVLLDYKYDSWYLHAFCRMRSGYREFKLPRILSLVVTGEHFHPRQHDPKRANPYDHRKKYSDNDKNVIDVRLRFSSACMARALDFFVGADKQFNDDGSLEILLKKQSTDLSKWLLPILLSFGDGAVVMGPPEVRNAVQAKLQKMMDNYREV